MLVIYGTHNLRELVKDSNVISTLFWMAGFDF
jgi:hypothetical protein